MIAIITGPGLQQPWKRPFQIRDLVTVTQRNFFVRSFHIAIATITITMYMIN